jgi:drug/metabolite transporter (DMT)-like permease
MSIGHSIYEKKRRRIALNGIFYASISSASFGFSPLFSLALIAAGLSNLDVLSYRWSVAAIVLVIYALSKKKSLRLNSFDEVWKIILLSALRAITSITLLIGYANIASGIASTINFMYPVVVTLCMMIFFGEQKSWINIGAIGLSLLGVYLMASGDGLRVEGGDTALGLTCSLISALSFCITLRRSFSYLSAVSPTGCNVFSFCLCSYSLRKVSIILRWSAFAFCTASLLSDATFQN